MGLLPQRRFLCAGHKGALAAAGSLEAASPQAEENCFLFERQGGDQRLLVALNFSSQEQNLSLPELTWGRVVLSTALDREGEVNLADFSLRANEGCIIEL